MDLNALRDALNRQRFQPFLIRLADGRSEQVPHPEVVAIAPRLVVVTRRDNSWSAIEPILIVSLEYKDGRQDPGAEATVVKRSDWISRQVLYAQPIRGIHRFPFAGRHARLRGKLLAHCPK